MPASTLQHGLWEDTLPRINDRKTKFDFFAAWGQAIRESGEEEPSRHLAKQIETDALTEVVERSLERRRLVRTGKV